MKGGKNLVFKRIADLGFLVRVERAGLIRSRASGRRPWHGRSCQGRLSARPVGQWHEKDHLRDWGRLQGHRWTAFHEQRSLGIVHSRRPRSSTPFRAGGVAISRWRQRTEARLYGQGQVEDGPGPILDIRQAARAQLHPRVKESFIPTGGSA